jgi:hypothetical protein
MNNFCFPREWFALFEDRDLALVLAAHRDAQAHDGTIALSDRDCAAALYMNRETVNKKKHALIERFRVLNPQPARRGQVRRFRIDWSRVAELVENVPRVAGKPATTKQQWPENQPPPAAKVAGKPATSEEWPENQPVKVAGIPPTSPEPYKERAPASASEASFSSLALASCETEAEENSQLNEAIIEAVERSRLPELGGKRLDEATVNNLRKAVLQLPTHAERREALEVIEEKCRDCFKHPEKARGWGYIVTAVRGLKRKPPTREEERGSDIKRDVLSAAATMGGKRS